MQFKSYRINTKHRGGKPTDDASMWSVSEWEEIQLFTEASRNEWRAAGEHLLWAVKEKSPARAHIGNGVNCKLYIAKFRCDANMEWHGYPVSPKGKDIPPEAVLERWLKKELIDKTDKSRILKGKFNP